MAYSVFKSHASNWKYVDLAYTDNAFATSITASLIKFVLSVHTHVSSD